MGPAGNIRQGETAMRKLTMIGVAVLLAATSAFAAEYYTKHSGDKRRGEVSDDTALVYVFRPAIVAYAIKTWTFADEQLIGVSKPKGYYFAQVPPGKRLLWSKAENTSGIEVELEGGQTYYFKTAIKMGFGKARVKLVQVTEEQAEKFFAKCSYCEPTDEGRRRAAEIAANRMDNAAASAEKRAAKKQN